jgi:hypothetical protein
MSLATAANKPVIHHTFVLKLPPVTNADRKVTYPAIVLKLSPVNSSRHSVVFQMIPHSTQSKHHRMTLLSAYEWRKAFPLLHQLRLVRHQPTTPTIGTRNPLEATIQMTGTRSPSPQLRLKATTRTVGTRLDITTRTTRTRRTIGTTRTTRLDGAMRAEIRGTRHGRPSTSNSLRFPHSILDCINTSFA